MGEAVGDAGRDREVGDLQCGIGVGRAARLKGRRCRPRVAGLAATTLLGLAEKARRRRFEQRAAVLGSPRPFSDLRSHAVAQ